MSERPTEPRCWWCGSLADSGEHKFKRRDLDQTFGKGPWHGTVAHGSSSPDRLGTANSSRSNRFKFSHVLCRDCNSRRSQPFDSAYDGFADYFRAREDEIYRTGKIDWRDVFGDDWGTQVDRVLGYWIKHIACRLVEAEVLLNPALPAFLDEPESLSHLHLRLEIREDVATLEKHSLREHGLSMRGLWMGDMFGWTRQDHGGQLVRAESHSSLGWLRMSYVYDFSDPTGGTNFVGRIVTLPRYWNLDPRGVLASCEECRQDR